MSNDYIASRGAHRFMFIFYTVLMALGVLLFTFPDILADILVETELAYDYYDGQDSAFVIGMFLLALVPTAGLYIANNSPYALARPLKIALNVFTFIGMAISLIFFIGVSADLSELSPMLIPSLIFSYATSTANQFFIARPAGGSGGDVDDSGVIGKAIGAAAKVGRAIVNFKNEHHDAYLIASTILCTLLSFLVLGLIMLVVSVIVGIIVFVFVGSIILGMLNNSDSTDSRSKIYEVWEDGYKRTLTYDSYAYSKGDRYIDDNGDYWITEDNGKTFYRE